MLPGDAGVLLDDTRSKPRHSNHVEVAAQPTPTGAWMSGVASAGFSNPEGLETGFPCSGPTTQPLRSPALAGRLPTLQNSNCWLRALTWRCRTIEGAESLFVMISGFSGGGKSTLLAELARRGRTVVSEPGRRIIADARRGNGTALPWIDPAAFGRRALEMSVADFKAAKGLTFFDRGVVDAAVAITATGGEYPRSTVDSMRYDRLFLAPPWPEIFVNDDDRCHSLEKALSDYDRVLQAYVYAGYDPIMLPRDTVETRADFIVRALPAG